MSYHDFLDAILARVPLQSPSRFVSGQVLTVLAYHAIEDPVRFEEQVALVERTMPLVGVNEVLASMHCGQKIADRAVLITFDDGHRSVLENALPILHKRSIPAAVYVVAGLLDTDQPFWWDEVKSLVAEGGRTEYVPVGLMPEEVVRVLKRVPNEQRLSAIEQLRLTAIKPAPRTLMLRRDELPLLEEGGITVGNHTLTHPCLHQCDEQTIRHELVASQEILTEALGHAPRTLAYPNGDHDPRVRQAAKDAGFEAAFLFDHRLSANPPTDPLRISRLRVDSTTSMDRFKIILSGLHSAIHHSLGRN